ncbi:hypothetical protein QVD17_07174 [Tagetes erecta]|uniref:Uncharacterized protein n=1 Tax=Tagetes erecta TaxID=13708 RepID=A0AAD8LNA2_TARER|nr:hypothetical protein QVD17_07174 [Tagetes erecta]
MKVFDKFKQEKKKKSLKNGIHDELIEKFKEELFIQVIESSLMHAQVCEVEIINKRLSKDFEHMTCGMEKENHSLTNENKNLKEEINDREIELAQLLNTMIEQEAKLKELDIYRKIQQEFELIARNYPPLPDDVKDKVCSKSCLHEVVHYRSHSFATYQKLKDEVYRHKKTKEEQQVFEKKIKSLTDELKESKSQEQILKATITNLEKALSKGQMEFMTTKDQLKEEMTSNETLQKEFKAYEDKLNSLSKNVDALLEEKHNLNFQLMNQVDELSKTKSEFAKVEAKLEKCKVSEQKLQEMFDSLHSSQTTSPETSPEMYMKTAQVKKESKPEEKKKSILYDRFVPTGFVKSEVSKAEPKEQVKKKMDYQVKNKNNKFQENKKNKSASPDPKQSSTSTPKFKACNQGLFTLNHTQKETEAVYQAITRKKSLKLIYKACSKIEDVPSSCFQNNDLQFQFAEI